MFLCRFYVFKELILDYLGKICQKKYNSLKQKQKKCLLRVLF